MAKRGRKSLKVEVDTNKLFNLSYYTLARALNSPSVTKNKKIEIALQIYCKHLPQKLEHSGGETNLYVTNLYGDKLIDEAKKRNIPLPIEIERRLKANIKKVAI